MDCFEGFDSVIISKIGLRVNNDFWVSIGASQFVLSVIREGYKIPCYDTPTAVYVHISKSTMQHYDFVAGSITELLAVGSVVQCLSPPGCTELLIPCRCRFNQKGRRGLF